MRNFVLVLAVCASLASCTGNATVHNDANNHGQGESKAASIKVEEAVSKSDCSILGVDVGYSRDKIKKALEEQKIRYKETELSISVCYEQFSGHKFDQIYFFFMPPAGEGVSVNTVAYKNCANKKEAEAVFKWFYNKYESRLGEYAYNDEFSIFQNKKEYPLSQSYKKGGNVLSIYITYHKPARMTYRSSDKECWRFYIEVE